MKLPAAALPEPAGSKLSQALMFADLGYWVHPLRPNGKEPLSAHGFKDATRDELAIRRWWKQWPDANIGIACEASGLIVADLDVKRGGTGPANWAALLADVEHEPGVQILTPSGGQHLIWRGEGVPSSVGKVAESVDIRADGGYIVGWGSVIDGKKYRTSDGEPFPRTEDLPAASEGVKAVATPRTGAENSGRPEAQRAMVAPQSNWDGTLYWEAATEYETNAVSAELGRLVDLGKLGWDGPGWDTTVHAVACNLFEIANADWSELTPERAESLIHEFAPSDENFGPREVGIKVDSALTTTAGKSRRVPLELSKKKRERDEDRSKAPERSLKIVNLADTVFEVTEWAWNEVIPLGILTGIAGWAGIGKSTLVSWIVAMVTRGRLEGDLHGDPASVLIVAGEDDISRQLAPRLQVADADLDFVNVVQPTIRMDDGQSIDTVMQLTEDMAGIRRMLIETGAKMLILDPILSFVDGNPNAQADVRRALDPLAALARELNIAVVVVMHFKKGNGIAGEKVSGSHVWRDALRSLLVMAVDEESGYRIVSIDKSNYSASKGRSMLFEVTGAEVWGKDTKGRSRAQQVSRAEFIGESPKSVDDILEAESAKRDGRRVVDDSTAEVIEWVREQSGPVSWATICRQFDIDPNGKDPESKKAKTNLTRKLSRAVERGDIEKADKGLYRRPTGLHPIAGMEDI